jgi:hypothetical protein
MIAQFTAVLLVTAFATVPVIAETWSKLPNRNLTPGAVNQSLSLTKICSTKWGQDARAVTAKMKQDVIKAYHFSVSSCPLTKLKGKLFHRVEIDHLVSRDIGGADDY